MILVSACLLGENCKYSGGNNANGLLIDYLKDKEYISVCPEVMGGLPTPRACCERVKDRVINNLGEDVTEAFIEGARQTHALHRRINARCVSCKYARQAAAQAGFMMELSAAESLKETA